MPYRVPTSRIPNTMIERINETRHRLSVLQEQISTGKRINRPSDDPIGAELVINLRTSRAEIAHFQKIAVTATQKLTAADNAFNNYQSNLDRVKSLLSAGLSDLTGQTSRDALANELEALKNGVISFANTRNGNEFLFGGTRQTVPPFDPVTGVPSAQPATAQFVQIEPGTNAMAVGVTAESFLTEGGVTITEDFDLAIAALRGTGDPVADQAALENAMTRMSVYQDLAAERRSTIGVNMNSVDKARERLSTVDLSVLESISNAEDADFAEAALALTDTQTTLEAILAITARGQRSLIDYLG
ncbi:MAG: hypothetical protein HKN33_01180 [Pyrinomonadaceae bacterium]|nr:hypothetical protein [Pyrinomonadaceae bacterium]